MIHAGKEPLLFLLIGLLTAFFIVRLSTRLMRANVRWWFGEFRPRGLHIHHMVFGIIVLVVVGILQVALQPSDHLLDVFALVFGIGVALVLDEFALVLHLEDVYWSEEGRKSIDAVVLAATFTGLLLLGLVPAGFPGGMNVVPSSARWALTATAALNLVPVVVTLLKGKLWTGVVGIFIPGVALIGAARLAKPRSPWAHLCVHGQRGEAAPGASARRAPGAAQAPPLGPHRRRALAPARDGVLTSARDGASRVRRWRRAGARDGALGAGRLGRSGGRAIARRPPATSQEVGRRGSPTRALLSRRGSLLQLDRRSLAARSGSADRSSASRLAFALEAPRCCVER